MGGKAQKIALYALLKAGIKQPIKVYEESAREYEELKRQGVDFICPGERGYPDVLTKRLTNLPYLFFRGSLRLLRRQRVAVVGSRDASEWSLKYAYLLAQALAEKGVNIVSGHARGIDTQAHLGALESKRGATTIVLAEGISHFKPRGELKERKGWEKRTLVLSQFKPSERWSAPNAMVRNRLICALADAVIVVEAGPERDESGKMSGAFNAGKTALELKVPLFVVVYGGQLPLNDGSSPPKLPEGNRQLIKRGAISLEGSPKEAAREVLECIRKKREGRRTKSEEHQKAPSPREETRPLPLSAASEGEIETDALNKGMTQ